MAGRILRLKMPAGFVARLTLALPLILAGGYFSYTYIGNWYLGLGLLAIWTVVTAFVLQLVRMKDLKLLLVPGNE
jgi:hypothetical protein